MNEDFTKFIYRLYKVTNLGYSIAATELFKCLIVQIVQSLQKRKTRID